MQKNKTLIGILITAGITLSFYYLYKVNHGFTWEEEVTLQEIIINDTIIYELENALVLIDRKDFLKHLKRPIGNVHKNAGDSTQQKFFYTYSNEKPFLAYLDSFDQTIVLSSKGCFKSKKEKVPMETIKPPSIMTSAGSFYSKKDTFILVRDYQDERNTYFNTLDRIIPKLIYERKAMLLSKKAKDPIGKIILYHQKWGTKYYLAKYQLMSGEYLMMKHSRFGFKS